MEEQKYDSTADTLFHIRRVNELLLNACMILMKRAEIHDNSKLCAPEKDLFDLHTPKLKELEYGTDEYREYVNVHLGPALEHHYANNPHHPEHYEDGVNGMNLFDLIEMFFDWKAASERQNNGNLMKSIRHNQDRYKLCEQLTEVFVNTAKHLGW